MIYNKSSLDLAHDFIKSSVKYGDVCIDATAGRGRDTVFLCELVGESGKVFAFDIQKEAIQSTKTILKEKNLSDRVILINDGHENMDKYVGVNIIAAVIFNFGYLPSGNHNVQTKSETSIKAITKSLNLIKPGGIVSLCIYYGGDSGFKERDALLDYVKTIDYKNFTVIVHKFANRPNCPPIVVDIQKHINFNK